MALIISSPTMATAKTLIFQNPNPKRRPVAMSTARSSTSFHVGAFLKPVDDIPILRDAIKEPLAFMGGVFAGILRLDLSEDPLKGWIARTAEAAGMSVEETPGGEEEEEGGDDGPLQIEIE